MFLRFSPRNISSSLSGKAKEKLYKICSSHHFLFIFSPLARAKPANDLLSQPGASLQHTETIFFIWESWLSQKKTEDKYFVYYTQKARHSSVSLNVSSITFYFHLLSFLNAPFRMTKYDMLISLLISLSINP